MQRLGLPPSAAGLNQLAVWADCTDPDQAVMLTGDLGALAQCVLRRHATSTSPYQGLLYVPWPEARHTERELLRDAGAAFCAAAQAALPSVQWQVFAQAVRARVGVEAAADSLRNYLDQVMGDPLHQFAVRLLQLRLWVDGFLDAPPGNGFDGPTWEAIERIFRFRLRRDAEDVPDHRHLRVHVQEGVYALNPHYFFQVVSAAEMPATGEDSFAALHTRYDTDAAGSAGFKAKLEERLAAFGAEGGPGMSAKEGYPGAQPLQRLFGWVRQQVDDLSEALERMFDCLRGGVQGLYTLLMRGFELLGRGIQAMIDPPAIVTSWKQGQIATTIGPDLHSLTRIEGAASPAHLHAHQILVEDFTRAIASVWQVVGKVLAWGISHATSPVSWVQLGLTVARLIAQEVVLVPSKEKV
jgi:hypothetical protein